MPFFKTTKNILVSPWEDEAFDANWMDSDSLVLPLNKNWDYSRELRLEDVSLWEQIYYKGGGLGLYVAWDPYAEFYMITNLDYMRNPNGIETYYGPGALSIVKKRCKELGIPLSLNTFWVDPEDMWLYTEKDIKNPL